MSSPQLGVTEQGNEDSVSWTYTSTSSSTSSLPDYNFLLLAISESPRLWSAPSLFPYHTIPITIIKLTQLYNHELMSKIKLLTPGSVSLILVFPALSIIPNPMHLKMTVHYNYPGSLKKNIVAQTLPYTDYIRIFGRWDPRLVCF